MPVREFELLKPKSYSPAPSKLTLTALGIWRYFEAHDWKIPGYEVSFHKYGDESYYKDSDESHAYRRVSYIRGKDFVIGYNGIQGQLSANLNDTAGFNFIAVPNFAIEFYEDNSGPTIYEYSGKKWEKEVEHLWSACMPGREDWQKVKCSIPLHNQVLLEFLFDPKKNAEAVKDQRASGFQTKQEFSNAAIAYLEKSVIPKLESAGSQKREMELANPNFYTNFYK